MLIFYHKNSTFCARCSQRKGIIQNKKIELCLFGVTENKFIDILYRMSKCGNVDTFGEKQCGTIDIFRVPHCGTIDTFGVTQCELIDTFSVPTITGMPGYFVKF